MLKSLTVGVLLSCAGQAFAAGAVNPALPADDTASVGDPDDQARHFLGTLIGGAAGLALPLLLSPLAPNCSAIVTPCDGAPQVLLIGATFLTMPTFAYLGHVLSGGHANFMSVLIGAAAGLLLTQGLIFFDRALGSPAQSLPIMLAGAGLTVMTMAAATLVRERMLETAGTQSTARRFGFTTLAAIAGQVGAAAVGVLLVLLLPTAAGVGLFAGSILHLALSPLLAFIAHDQLGGKGSPAAGYLGAVVGAAAGFLSVLAFSASLGPFGGSSVPQTVALLGMVTSLSLAFSFSISTALEISHHAVLSRADAGTQKLGFAITPITQGAMVMAGLQF